MAPHTLDEACFEEYVSLVYSLTGVTVEPDKRQMLSSRIRRRLRALRLADPRDYLRMLKDLDAAAEEVISFVDAVTTHKTSFFRTSSVWDALQEELRRPEISRAPCRIWSCASSTGQEPYSLAMMLHKERGESSIGRWEVVASDVSPLTVEQASQGIYEKDLVRDISRARPGFDYSRYFERDGEDYRVHPILSDGVKFRVHNLLEPMFETFDIVFLRNVIIYFSDEDKNRVIEHVLRTLRPGCLLVIGESESLIHYGEKLEFLGPCLYRKK